jgi:protein-S-isoprenylcysteine O-methyltransferase Ste14
MHQGETMAPFALLYAALSYVIFLASFVYAIGFIGNFVVPKTIDAPMGAIDWTAWLIDALVLGAFAIQHSVMARPAFKRWWTRFVPEPIERATYVLVSTLLLILIFVAWQPIPAVIWSVGDGFAAQLLVFVYAIGWLIVLASTFMISHFELFGLTQAWRALRNQPTSVGSFTVAFLYHFVRHPIMLGFVIVFWATPTMTTGHLLFALLTTGYILIGIHLEERDLLAHFGEAYVRYRARVPMLVPFVKSARGRTDK